MGAEDAGPDKGGVAGGEGRVGAGDRGMRCQGMGDGRSVPVMGIG